MVLAAIVTQAYSPISFCRSKSQHLLVVDVVVVLIRQRLVFPLPVIPTHTAWVTRSRES
jgi:hypothetical protein